MAYDFHEEFIQAGSTHVIELKDTTNKKAVRLTWVYDPPSKKKYTLTIERTGSGPYTPKPYSLYNLCVQNRNCETKVKIVSGTDAIIIKNDLVTQAAQVGDTCVVPFTGVLAPYLRKPKASEIWYLYFEGPKCVLEIEGCRVMDSPTMPYNYSVASSHDNLPPPPYSGSEN